MSKEKLLANTVFLVHLALYIVIVFGWLFPSIWVFYMAIMFITLVQDVFLNYCILSKWEFLLRKKSDPKVDYHYNFSSFYIHKFVGEPLSPSFVRRWAIVFLSISIFINLYFRYFYVYDY